MVMSFLEIYHTVPCKNSCFWEGGLARTVVGVGVWKDIWGGGGCKNSCGGALQEQLFWEGGGGEGGVQEQLWGNHTRTMFGGMQEQCFGKGE